MDPVTLHNPKDGQTVTVTVPAEKVRLVAAGYQEAAPYDPAGHTVAEVNKYMADNPDEATRVLQAEQAGRNRKGVTGNPGGTSSEDGAGPDTPDTGQE